MKQLLLRIPRSIGRLNHLVNPRRNKSVQPGSFVESRLNVVAAVIFASFLLLMSRAVMVQLFPSSAARLSAIADKQYQQRIMLSRYRGQIRDRRGEPLAISIRMPSFYINPRALKLSNAVVQKLAQTLEMPPAQIQKLSGKKSYFVWLKRKVPLATAEKVRALNISGVQEVWEPARFYPAGEAAAQLIGFVGLDDSGLSGLERQYEQALSGNPLELIPARDAKGNQIFLSSQDAAPQTTGHQLVLTIDRAVQEIAEDALRTGIVKAKAKGGFALVSDPHTGQILAVANVPTFDPNRGGRIDIDLTKNRALMDSFEPGSVIKPFVVAGAMRANLVNERSEFDCEGGKIQIGKHTIHDAHPPKSQYLNVEETVVHSSNVCTYKIAQLLGSERMSETLKEFGFGARMMSVGFPGEALGFLSPWKDWKEVRFANIAFGQGLSVTGLELAQAYGAIANGGTLLKPYYVERLETPQGAIAKKFTPQSVGRTLDPSLARRLRKILEKTVADAISNAKPQSYSAAGKTGTAQKIDPKTRAYSKTKHLSTFIGFAPALDPHLVIYVQVDEPDQPQSYGSLWAAPIFADIAEKSLRYLNVAADDLKSEGVELKVSKTEGKNPEADGG